MAPRRRPGPKPVPAPDPDEEPEPLPDLPPAAGTRASRRARAALVAPSAARPGKARAPATGAAVARRTKALALRPPPHAWIVPGALVIAERPGGGGRSHRTARRHAELEWWKQQGVRTIVSGMRARNSLTEYATLGFGVRWHPLINLAQGRSEMPRLAESVAEVLAREPGVALVHCDRVTEWLAAMDAAIRMRLGLARTRRSALAQARADGLPVGDLSRELLGNMKAGGMGRAIP